MVSSVLRRHLMRNLLKGAAALVCKKAQKAVRIQGSVANIVSIHFMMNKLLDQKPFHNKTAWTNLKGTVKGNIFIDMH